MKGVILAGGNGTRLSPLTKVIGKQLLPVYDKPMIYYPISTLIHAGVSEVLIISSPQQINNFEMLLGDGRQFGISIQFLVQNSPGGIAQGVQLAQPFTESEPFWFILGDNLFHGPSFGSQLKVVSNQNQGATIFSYRVKNPEEYGVLHFGADDQIIDIVEKPSTFISNFAIPGIYYFDQRAFSYVDMLKVSPRGELEVTDLLKEYLRKNILRVESTSRGNVWFDLGTPETLLHGSEFVHSIQERQGLLVGSPEEASLNAGRLSMEELKSRLFSMPLSPYKKSLEQIF